MKMLTLVSIAVSMTMVCTLAESVENEQNACPEHFFLHSATDTCYLFNHLRKSFFVKFHEARRICGTYGAEIFSPTSQDKIDLLLINKICKNEICDENDGYWIGMSDIAKEGKFTWLNGTPVSWTFWEDRQPSNSNEREDCVESRMDRDGKWNDTPCGKFRRVACERPKGKSRSYNGDCDTNSLLYTGTDMCYRSFGRHVTKAEAEQYCIEIGGVLAAAPIGILTEAFFSLIESFYEDKWYEGSTISSDYDRSPLCEMPAVHTRACGTDSVYFSPLDICYKVVFSAKSWDGAHHKCRRQGGYLIKVDSQDAHTFVAQNTNTSVWIGAKRDRGIFKWNVDSSLVSDGSSFWAEGEPNNMYHNQHCIVSVLQTDNTSPHLWNDKACNNKYNFICQFRPK